MNAASTPPKYGRRLYYIHDKGDGTVDVYLRPGISPKTDHHGCADHDSIAIVVRDVDPNDADFGGDLEGHIRAHYTAWCESGEEVYI